MLLQWQSKEQRSANECQLSMLERYLYFSIGPPRDLDHHVVNGLFSIGEKGNVVKGRDSYAVLFYPNKSVLLERWEWKARGGDKWYLRT